MSQKTHSIAAGSIPLVPVFAEPAAWRLLAVRRAGAAFDGPFRLRAPRFEALLRERRELRATSAALRDLLVDALHAAVPRAADASSRRSILNARRDVFNARPVRLPQPGADDALVAGLARHNGMLEREAAIFDEARAEIEGEERAAIGALLRDQRFQLGFRYSSPALSAALEHGTGGDARQGVYAYAAKFISKANPFHVFGEVIFAPASGIRADAPHETVLDASLAFALEKRILAEVEDGSRVWTYLRPHARRSGSLDVWLVGPPRVVSLRDNPLLERIAGFFAERGAESGRPVARWDELEAVVLTALPPEQHEAGRRYLALLVEQDILVRYLLPDLGDLAPLLGLAGGALGPAAELFARHHLAATSTRELANAHAELAAAHASVAELPPLKYFVNSYSADDTTAHERAAAEVAGALGDLKACFGASHNFSAHDHVIRSFAAERLEACGGRMSYLDLQREYLRDRAAIVTRYLPHIHRPAEEARRAAWLDECAAESGTLAPDRLRELSELPRQAGVRGSLCFNGPFDYHERTYHISNTFAGSGHFVGRYLLRRGTAPTPPVPDDGVVDVEVATPPWRNLNLVVRHFPIGCGFEARYAHRYERWIDPAEVELEAAESGIVYRHAPSGTRLRFHYRGYLLTQYVPSEYQFFLLGHADTFANPFHGSEPLEGGGAEQHDAGLSYGPVRVRRERWIARARLLAALDGDDLRYAAKLGDWLAERAGPGATHWYYRVFSADPARRKPLFLDLHNPLSASVFRRAIAAAKPDASVVLTVMDPPAGHLADGPGGRYVTELMIEV